MKNPIPIHITYFTMLADEDGTVSSFNDVYGHDRRILDALKGTRSIKQIAAGDPALALKRQNKILEEAAAFIQRSKPGAEFSSRSNSRRFASSDPYASYSPPRAVKYAKTYSPPSYFRLLAVGAEGGLRQACEVQVLQAAYGSSRQPSVTNPFNFGYLN